MSDMLPVLQWRRVVRAIHESYELFDSWGQLYDDYVMRCISRVHRSYIRVVSLSEYAVLEWRRVVTVIHESYGSFDSWGQLYDNFI